jgi:hypothetical protein
MAFSRTSQALGTLLRFGEEYRLGTMIHGFVVACYTRHHADISCSGSSSTDFGK